MMGAFIGDAVGAYVEFKRHISEEMVDQAL